MSHSTHVGFSEPPISFESFSPRGCCARFAFACSLITPLLQSLAVGVENMDRLTALPNSFPLGPLLLPSFEKPWGVGHIATACANEGPHPFPVLPLCLSFNLSWRALNFSGVWTVITTVGVGHHLTACSRPTCIFFPFL